MSKFSNLLNGGEQEEVKQKIYKGMRLIPFPEREPRGQCVVTVDGKPLMSIWQPKKNAPEFEWGSRWSRACKNLASSILRDVATEDIYSSADICNRFKEDYVEKKFSFDGWEIKEYDILDWIDKQVLEMEKQRAKAIA
jgi:hypothetical protein